MTDAPRLRTRARIAAHVVWDHQTRPIASAPDDVPWRADAVSIQWLTAVLCRDVPGARVESFVVSGGHDGSSIRRKLTVLYNAEGTAAGLPQHLFTKATPTLLTRLTAGLAAHAEAAFYTQIRPDLPIEAPVHRHSAVDPASLRSIHVFDDLVETRQATFCNQSTPISRDQAEQIVDTLAELHGAFHGSDQLQLLPWLPAFRRFVEMNDRNGFRVGHEQAMVEAADLIPTDVVDRKDRIWPMLLGSLDCHDTEPSTLLHSDVHLGNWYVTGDGTMGIGDWATVCIGHWARDFAYAVTTTLDVEDRRAWERDLLERYLARMGERCGMAIPFSEAWDRYRAHTFAALFMWTPTLCHPPTMPDMQPREMSLEMIRRITTAISDLESFDCPIGAGS